MNGMDNSKVGCAMCKSRGYFVSQAGVEYVIGGPGAVQGITVSVRTDVPGVCVMYDVEGHSRTLGEAEVYRERVDAGFAVIARKKADEKETSGK